MSKTILGATITITRRVAIEVENPENMNDSDLIAKFREIEGNYDDEMELTAVENLGEENDSGIYEDIE